MNEIAVRISRELASHVANRSVAVAVKEYAPIFVVGDVQKPGKYEYRPGMIVLELFALGGGLRESNAQRDTSGIQLIAAQQEYEDMSMQLLSQDIRRVRWKRSLTTRNSNIRAMKSGLFGIAPHWRRSWTLKKASSAFASRRSRTKGPTSRSATELHSGNRHASEKQRHAQPAT